MTATLPARTRTDPPRLLAGFVATGRPASLAEHLAQHGPLPVHPGATGRQRLIDLIDRAGLRGRGGGGFPTARKLRTVAGARGPRVVLANGCEGDPTSAKDRLLLDVAPHLVLDGIALAAHAVGADTAVLAVHTGAARRARLLDAIAQRSGGIPISVAEVPDRYVASEESALVNFLTSGDARPTTTPPRPSERGVRGRPTLVDNVETLAHLALIARHGSAWFRAAGTVDSPGTTLVTVGGAVRRPGIVEIGLGTPLGTVLDTAVAAAPLQAVLVGGLGGSWIPIDAAGLGLSPEGCRAAGAGLGVASLVALPRRACGIAETARILRHLAGESARQCGPCMFGLPAIAQDMTDLAAARGPRHATIARLRGRLGVLPGRGACAHPDGAARLAATALRVFAADAAEHASGHACTATAGPAVVPLRRTAGSTA